MGFEIIGFDEEDDGARAQQQLDAGSVIPLMQALMPYSWTRYLRTERAQRCQLQAFLHECSSPAQQVCTVNLSGGML